MESSILPRGIKARTNEILLAYQTHRRHTGNCKRCDLHKSRSHVVCARGYIPCKLLIIGEAPGLSEDTMGEPFRGPAGDKLEEILDLAQNSIDVSIRPAVANIVACCPRDGEGKIRSPSYGEALSCADRLTEFLKIARPHSILCLGRIAEKYLGLQLQHIISPVRVVSGIHPSAILRMQKPQDAELAVKRLILTIQELFR